MTAKYFAILTNYGAAQLANAVALGTQMNISKMAVGDGGGTLPVPDPAQTKLVRETRRAAVNQVSVDEKNPNFIIAEQVIPENEGGWFIREIGLFDDNGGLIAVGNAPETYKPNLQEGSGRTQVIQMVLMVSSTQAITLKVDPSVVLATREYVTKSIDAAIQESEARAAKTYQPIGDYVLHPYLKLELLKKIDKADIAQQLGNDPAKVASLQLVTTELGKKAGIADINNKLAKDQNGADIPDKPKFIENLGLPENIANGKYFDSEGVHRRIITKDGGHYAVLSETGYFGVKDDNGSLWEFNPLGVLIAGSVPVARLTGTDEITVPVGTVITVAHNKQVPGRFLRTIGTAVSRTAYADLFAAIGTTYGAGNGSTTFNLPDTRDEFLRFGSDSRAVGSKQGDAMRNIIGSYAMAKPNEANILDHATGPFRILNNTSQWYSIKTAPTVGQQFVMHFNLENTSLPLASENRPRNIALAGWIRY